MSFVLRRAVALPDVRRHRGRALMPWYGWLGWVCAGLSTAALVALLWWLSCVNWWR